MPDYIQLLESKLTPGQKRALNAITDIARTRSTPIFLTGGAVRNIISGASIRDVDITVQTNPLKFKKDLGKAGFTVTGEHEKSQTLYLRFEDAVRLEVSAARTEDFPKPARPEYRPAGILDDLRRRDFTANAMALSLNEGSWGLLLDPLNGTADISARQLRLASPYGFLEDPIRLVRATRLLSRTGWEMDERTKERYEDAKAAASIEAIQNAQRGYELEEIAYEEEPLQVMKALESEGWMDHLSQTWSSKSADTQGIERLRERLVQLLMAGLHPDPSPAQFRLLTAKLSQPNLTALKRLFVRTDLIESSAALDRNAKKVQQQILSKDAARPSQLWKLFHGANPDAVLWLFFTGKGATIQHRFENFFTKWPEARQKIPNTLLQEMRIVPGVSGYDELLDKLTFALMDNELADDAAVRKFAEPYSPPAPPPTVIVRRGRASKKATQPKGTRAKGKKAAQKVEGAAGSAVDLAASAETKPDTSKKPENGASSAPPAAVPSISKKGSKASAGGHTPNTVQKASAAVKKSAKGKAEQSAKKPAKHPAKPAQPVRKTAGRSSAKASSKTSVKSSPKSTPKRSVRANNPGNTSKRDKTTAARPAKKSIQHNTGSKSKKAPKTKTPAKKRPGK